MDPLDTMESALEERLTERSRRLGMQVAEHPLVCRLKRLEEIIREDPELRDLWAQLEEFDTSSRCGSGGCGSGGCSSGGCGTGKEEAASPLKGKASRMDLYARFSDEPVLQEYVQVRHRFYVLVDSLVETFFENLYGQPWRGSPEVGPHLGGFVEEPSVGFAGVSLVDILPD